MWPLLRLPSEMNFTKRFRSHVICFPQVDKATYSASPELSVTRVCLFDAQNIGAELTVMTIPVVERRVS